MIPVNRIQERWRMVERHLATKCSGEMRQDRKFAVVSKRVGLNASEELIVKTGRLWGFPKQQLVGAVHIFDACPKIMWLETESGFRQVPVEVFSGCQRVITSPEQ